MNSPASGKTRARKEVVEDLTAAIIAIENELGTDPAGSLSDVKTFLQLQHNTDGTHKNTHGPHFYIDEANHANFSAAVTAAANKVLVITRSINLDANTTIPSTTSIMPVNPGIINANGFTLTINGPVVGNPMHKWLSGFSAGGFIFESRQLIDPIWTGFAEGSGLGAANSTAWSVMMNALPSANRRPMIWVSYGRYEIAGDPAILIDRSCTIFWNKAIFIQTDYSQNHVAVKINKGTTGVSLSEVTIHEPVITNGLGGAVDYARLNTSGGTAEGSGLVVKGCSGLIIHHPFIDGFRQNLYFTDEVGGDSTSLIEIHSPQLRNGLYDFYVRPGGTSVNAINVFGGAIENNAACSGANARLVLLDGRDGTQGSDGINFHGTTIQNVNAASPTKIEIKKVDSCRFSGAYYDQTAGGGADIIIDSDCNDIVFSDGEGLVLQRFVDNGVDTRFELPGMEYYTRDISAEGSFFTFTPQQSCLKVIKFTGVLAEAINIYVQKNKTQYTVYNNTTGAYSLWVYVVGGAGAGIQVLQGEAAILYCDGTDIVMVNKRMTAQADSVATTVAGIVTDFNTLLGKLRTAKLLIT